MKLAPVQLCLTIIIVLVAGCKSAPTESLARDLITKYFESRNFVVLELKISTIRKSAGERRYMTAEAYIVYIPSITLEAAEDMAGSAVYKKGQRVKFENVAVKIEQDLYQEGMWSISDIKGIPLA